MPIGSQCHMHVTHDVSHQHSLREPKSAHACLASVRSDSCVHTCCESAVQQAVETGDTKAASRHSKLKTKECRYSLPMDALVKGFKQKLALEKFREDCIRGETQACEVSSLQDMPILMLRQKMLDVSRAEVACLLVPSF